MMQELGKSIGRIEEEFTEVKQDLAEFRAKVKQSIKKIDNKFDILNNRLLEDEADIRELKNRTA